MMKTLFASTLIVGGIMMAASLPASAQGIYVGPGGVGVGVGVGSPYGGYYGGGYGRGYRGDGYGRGRVYEGRSAYGGRNRGYRRDF